MLGAVLTCMSKAHDLMLVITVKMGTSLINLVHARRLTVSMVELQSILHFKNVTLK
jgi:hypothetical protein